MSGGRWVGCHDDGRIRRHESEGFWRPLAAAAASAGDPTTLQEVLVGPAVSIWPPPSVLVRLLGDAAGLFHGGDVEASVGVMLYLPNLLIKLSMGRCCILKKHKYLP